MLYTNYYECCRLFQTTIKNCKVPHLRSTDLNLVEVIPSLAATNKSNNTMLATATSNCAVTNATYNENKYYVVT